MKSKATNKVMSTLIFASLIVMLIGEIFKIQHYPYGNMISFVGMGTFIIVSLVEMDRLKKIINNQ
jgi:hypothetical protein